MESAIPKTEAAAAEAANMPAGDGTRGRRRSPTGTPRRRRVVAGITARLKKATHWMSVMARVSNLLRMVFPVAVVGILFLVPTAHDMLCTNNPTSAVYAKACKAVPFKRSEPVRLPFGEAMCLSSERLCIAFSEARHDGSPVVSLSWLDPLEARDYEVRALSDWRDATAAWQRVMSTHHETGGLREGRLEARGPRGTYILDFVVEPLDPTTAHVRVIFRGSFWALLKNLMGDRS
jgi:hypothetical protein